MRKLLILTAAVLVPYAWLCAIRFIGLSDGTESSADAYYHVAMADRFPAACVSKTFPYTTMSVWKDHFYDKELLYHGMIRALRGCNRAMGLPLDPPFNGPALFFPLLLLGVFVLMLRAYGIPAILFFSTLLVVGCPFFSHRLLVLRPHVLAIALVLAFAWCLGRVRRPRQLWRVFGFGFLMAYAYSNPHFLLLPAIVFGALRWRKDQAMAVLLPVVTLAGIAAGLTLHPQFPNTFLLWKIQALDVLHQSIRGSTPVLVGVELYRPDAQWLLRNTLCYALAAANIVHFRILWRLCKQRVSEETSCFFILQCAGTAGTFLSKRAIEYAWPFAVISAALLFRDLSRAGYFEKWPQELRQRGKFAVQAGLVVCFIGLGIFSGRAVQRSQTPELKDFARWANENLPEGTLIGNPNWSDFAQLFYSAPRFRYLLGIEPMFAYHADPGRVGALEAFRTGARRLSPAQLRELTGARYAFVSVPAWELAQDMHKDGFYFVYQGEDGWLFDLEAGLAPK